MGKNVSKKQERGGTRLSIDQLDGISGGQYVPGTYKQEASAFLKACLGDEMYGKIMHSGSGQKYPYVAAKIYLNGLDWEKYVWIEQHGSLEGFPV